MEELLNGVSVLLEDVDNSVDDLEEEKVSAIKEHISRKIERFMIYKQKSEQIRTYQNLSKFIRINQSKSEFCKYEGKVKLWTD